jgi:adenylyl- and sulfurtransferase ThiI
LGWLIYVFDEREAKLVDVEGYRFVVVLNDKRNQTNVLRHLMGITSVAEVAFVRPRQNGFANSGGPFPAIT